MQQLAATVHIYDAIRQAGASRHGYRLLADALFKLPRDS